MTTVAQLYSGSEGNACYIGDDQAAILIDAGKTTKALTLGVSSLGFSLSAVRGIFITHEHTDHIHSLKVLTKKHPDIPVYATEGTLAYLEAHQLIFPHTRLCEMRSGGVEVAGMHIAHFPTSHDGVQPCGYVVHTKENRKIGVCTDLGWVTPDVEKALMGCDGIVLESNHDVNMLKNGGYPWYLKQRILGQNGHLSNRECAGLAARLLLSGCRHFALAHLSKENNLPGLAFEENRQALENTGARYTEDFTLQVAPRYEATVLFSFS